MKKRNTILTILFLSATFALTACSGTKTADTGNTQYIADESKRRTDPRYVHCLRYNN